MTDYKKLLEHSFEMCCIHLGCPPHSRVSFLSDEIFDITTYDDEIAETFGRKALEVCKAITERTTFKYIDDPGQYIWFLMLCNLPFFAEKISWGTSIRGAFWYCCPDQSFKVESCGLFEGDEQIMSISLTREEWPLFVSAMLEFAEEE